MIRSSAPETSYSPFGIYVPYNNRTIDLTFGSCHQTSHQLLDHIIYRFPIKIGSTIYAVLLGPLELFERTQFRFVPLGSTSMVPSHAPRLMRVQLHCLTSRLSGVHLRYLLCAVESQVIQIFRTNWGIASYDSVVALQKS